MKNEKQLRCGYYNLNEIFLRFYARKKRNQLRCGYYNLLHNQNNLQAFA